MGNRLTNHRNKTDEDNELQLESAILIGCCIGVGIIVLFGTILWLYAQGGLAIWAYFFE